MEFIKKMLNYIYVHYNCIYRMKFFNNVEFNWIQIMLMIFHKYIVALRRITLEFTWMLLYFSVFLSIFLLQGYNLLAKNNITAIIIFFSSLYLIGRTTTIIWKENKDSLPYALIVSYSLIMSRNITQILLWLISGAFIAMSVNTIMSRAKDKGNDETTMVLYHEAGHCAVSLLLGKEPVELSTFSYKDTNSYYRYVSENKEDEIETMIIAYAGLLAEVMLKRKQQSEVDYEEIVNHSIWDIRDVYHLSYTMYKIENPTYLYDLQREAYSQALSILQNHWGLVEEIVKNLKIHKRLNKAQIKSIFTDFLHDFKNAKLGELRK